MWTQRIKDLKAEYFDIFHNPMIPQWKKDCLLKHLHEEIGVLDRENQRLWNESKAKAGDLKAVIEFWKKENNQK